MKYNLNWLIEKYKRGDQSKFIFFWGHTGKNGETIGKFIFSQWYPSAFIVDGLTYYTAEHWMMAKKAMLFNDEQVFQNILRAVKPAEAKELGRQISNFNEDVWNEKKYEIVKQGNFYKFSQHEELKEFLLNTGDRVIVEASPVDKIWGVGLSHDSPQIENPETWKGENLLGFALMEVRDLLKN